MFFWLTIAAICGFVFHSAPLAWFFVVVAALAFWCRDTDDYEYQKRRSLERLEEERKAEAAAEQFRNQDPSKFRFKPY